MARRAINIEALPAAVQNLARHGKGKHVRGLPIDFPGVEQFVWRPASDPRAARFPQPGAARIGRHRKNSSGRKGCSEAAHACQDGIRRTPAKDPAWRTAQPPRIRRARLCVRPQFRTPRAHSAYSMNTLVVSRSNFGSPALMHRKKRSREASAKRGTLKTG